MARRRLSLLAAVLLGAGLLSACSEPSNAPTEFNDQTQANFIATCTGNWEGSGTTLAQTDTCQCAYDAVVAEYADNFAGFQELDNQLRSNPEAMPQNLKDAFAQCPGWGGAGTTGMSEAQGTTTVPRAAPTAPTGTGTSTP